MAIPIRKARSRNNASTKLLVILVTVFVIVGCSTFYTQSSATSSTDITKADELKAQDIIALADENPEAVAEPETTDAAAAATTTTTSSSTTITEAASASTAASNVEIKANRAAILSQCSDGKPDPNKVRNDLFKKFPEDAALSLPKQMPKPSIQRCKNVVLDFGANVGDTAGHLIDSGLPNCPNVQKDEFLRLMLGERKMEVGKWNMVTTFLKQMMDANKLFPEDYCYYGIEGNPVFTERLQGIEDFIDAIEPKPLLHASFLTESVGAGEYGMTKLYLDTVNTKENFWGSSIMKGHQDVRKSMDEGKLEEAPAHDVMGYTITKLMDMTLLGLKEGATEEEKKGAHLLLKVDIEGGEFVLTQEVVKSKALCKFIEMGNTVDVVIETHSQRVTGPNPLMFQFGGWKKELTECGVTFRNLQAWWA